MIRGRDGKLHGWNEAENVWKNLGDDKAYSVASSKGRLYKTDYESWKVFK